jgi:5-methylcytosine-specific restriction endonuclease McrA
MHKLRRISYSWPARQAAYKKARVERGIYECASCQHKFGPKEIQLDHINPVIDPHDGFNDWNDYINRLFVNEDGWQVLCRSCHSYKTHQENLVRYVAKK